MNLFVIDENKCKRCGLCVTDCPVSVITLSKPDVPRTDEESARRCINCGHCVSVCPYDAFSLNTMNIEKCQLLQDGWRLSPDVIEQFLKGRRSIRHYKDQLVDRDLLTKVIDMACYAPTASNSQPENWLVVYEPEDVQHIARMVIDWIRGLAQSEPDNPMANYTRSLVGAWDMGLDLICRNAPHLVFAFAPGNNPMSESSCTIALTYLELAALPFGLGTCWAGFVQMAVMSPAIQEFLDLPEGHQCFGAMMIGYPEFEYHRIPLRKMDITWI